MEILGMLFFGSVAGFVASLLLLIWGATVWAIFVQRRSDSALGAGETDVSPLTAFKRILFGLPVLALIHPGPWVVGLIIYVTVLFLIGSLGFEWVWFFIAFYGSIVCMFIFLMKNSD